MKLLRNIFDKAEPLFTERRGKLRKFYPLYEVIDTFFFTSGEVCSGTTHIRDGMDSKRMMSVVVMALIPCMLFGMYNIGLQANTAIISMGGLTQYGWRETILQFIGVPFDPRCIWANFIFGAMYFIPIYLVTNIVGGLWEVLFSLVRKHEVNEGFFVTGALFPLILPPTIPLWQVAVGISFGVVFGKEIFGGTGRNFLNPALVARAFLFFAYPAEISGNAVWTAVDGFTGATALGEIAQGGMSVLNITWWDAFWGFIPGSIGETSTAACLLGAIFLLATGIGSWRIIISILVGMTGLSLLFNILGSETNIMFSITPWWHFVLGGFAFGTIFMATDPVTATMTFTGQYFYGLLIGIMVVLIRVINPAFPEGVMLAILFGNVFAPLIDYFVVWAHINKRRKKYAEG